MHNIRKKLKQKYFWKHKGKTYHSTNDFIYPVVNTNYFAMLD